jgi:hydroxymethylbilane synthase
MRAVAAERSFLRTLGGGCLAPATAFARVEGGRISIRSVVGDPDGKTLLRDRDEGPDARPEELGDRLARQMLDAGAGEILRLARSSGSGGAA